MTPNEDSGMEPTSVTIEVVRAPSRLNARLRDELAECWAETANAGGAVGLPSTPVTAGEVHDAVEALAANVEDGRTTIVVARDAQGLAGWVSLAGNEAPVVSHWATVRRLQTHPRVQHQGVGTLLMQELVRIASEDGLEQLHLAVRGGTGLEPFYERLGWQVVGSWPRALRIAPGDTRDEVLMMLAL